MGLSAPAPRLRLGLDSSHRLGWPMHRVGGAVQRVFGRRAQHLVRAERACSQRAPSLPRSMLVVVVAVRRVPMLVVHVIGMVVVLHRLVAAAGTVLMVVRIVRRVHVGRAFVPMVFMPIVTMPVMVVVGVTVVSQRRMAATVVVLVVVIVVRVMVRGRWCGARRIWRSS